MAKHTEGSADCLFPTKICPLCFGDHSGILSYVATNHSCCREWQKLTNYAQVQTTNMSGLPQMDVETL